jgi:hydrogenase maturation protease
VSAERILVVGVGNTYRRDDGVAMAVVDALRVGLGRAPLGPLDDGFDDLGHRIDMVILHQMVPELAEMLGDYDLVVFVDAHVPDLPDPLYQQQIEVAYHAPFVYHQTHPATVLELARRLHGRAPQGVLLSVRGHDFDFGEGLSPATAQLVPHAVDRILALAALPEGD